MKYQLNQHLLKFMQVLCSLYSEDLQFADFQNVHPPPSFLSKKQQQKPERFSCPSSQSSTTFGELLPNTSQFFFPVSRCTSLSSLKHKAWVRRYFGLKYYYAASNGCTHGQCHSENLSSSSAHIYIAPSLWLLMWIDLFVVLQAIAPLCLNYRMQISLCVCVCVCGRGEGGKKQK